MDASPPTAMRTLLFVSLLALAACDSLDAFDADRGSYTATVRGEHAFDLRGSGYYGTISDSPPITEIQLTDTDAPAIRLRFPVIPVRVGRYTMPDDATATFALADENPFLDPYVATSGSVQITRADGVSASGTFSFEARRASGTVTITGSFVAE